MEPRGAQHHRERLADALREEISAIIEGELRDPRIGLATVTEVLLGPGRRSMRVLIGFHGSEDEGERTLEGLDAAKGYIRREVTIRLGLRRSPDIIFQLDKSEQYSARIEQLLERMKKRQR